jgi:hypothetical protein
MVGAVRLSCTDEHSDDNGDEDDRDDAG